MRLRNTLSLLLLTGLPSAAALGVPCVGGASLVGMVVDPSGAAIPGVTVTVGHQSVHSDKSGHFALACINSNARAIHVVATGFEPRDLELRGERSVTVRLSISELKQRVDVDGSDESGVGAREDHGSGTRLLGAKELEGMANDPDEFKRQLQVLSASGGSAPGQAVVTVDGFTGDIALPSKSSIAAIRVNPDLFSAEYDKPPYSGGRVEVFSKPGDTFHGALFASESFAGLNANDPLTPAGSTPASKLDYGFELGGPLVKHKGDFFIALQSRDTKEFETVNATVLGGSGTPVPLNEAIAAPEVLWMGTLRSDWNLTPGNTLAVSYTLNRNQAKNQGSGGLVLPEAGYQSAVDQQSVRLTDSAVLSSNLINQFRLGYTWKTTTDLPLSTAPSIDVAGEFIGGGSTAGSLHDQENDIEADDQIGWTHKQHAFTFGVTSLGIRARAFQPDLFNGQYLFAGDGTLSSLAQYGATLLGMSGVGPTTYQVTNGSPHFLYEQWQVAAYAQDDWKISSNLSLSFGLRFAAQTSPSVASNTAPRFGIAWSPDKKRKWVLRGHAGLFYNPLDASVLAAAYRLNGSTQTQTLFYSPSYAQPLTDGMAAIKTIRTFAPGLAQAPSAQFQVAAERQLPQHWHLQASWSYASGWDLLRSLNINAPQITEQSQNPYLAPRPLLSDENILQFQPSGILRGDVVFAGAEQHSYRHVGLFVGYLYMNLRTDADNPMLLPQSSYSNAGEIARASWEPAHQLFGMVQISLPYKMSLSTEFAISSGTPYNVVTGQDNNGDGSFNDRPSLATMGGPGVYQTPFGLLTTQVVNGDLPRNAGTLPALLHIDTSLSRTFALPWNGFSSEHQSITLNLQAYNLLNHTNVTQVDNVVSSTEFGQPLTAEAARRVEIGLRYSF